MRQEGVSRRTIAAVARRVLALACVAAVIGVATGATGAASDLVMDVAVWRGALTATLVAPGETRIAPATAGAAASSTAMPAQPAAVAVGVSAPPTVRVPSSPAPPVTTAVAVSASPIVRVPSPPAPASATQAAPTKAPALPAAPTLTVVATPTPTSTRAPVAAAAPGTAKRFGVALAGGSFSEHDAARVPGTIGQDYIYPADAWRMAYFRARGLDVLRVDFLWERLQRSPFGPLHQPDVDQLRRLLDAASVADQVVILDMHNYGRYQRRPLTVADGPLLADVWRRLALAFRDHPAVWGYELMNEPHDLPGHGQTWASLAQAATDAIRSVDHRAWVLVPGYGWQSALGWAESNVSLDVRDPAGRLLYAAHQYFDSNFDGVYAANEVEANDPERAAKLIAPFQTWLAARGARGFFTEYGVPPGDPRWLRVLDGFLTAIERDQRLLGGTYWAAGPWWSQHVRDGVMVNETYPLSVEPVDRIDRPQLAVLAAHPSR